MVFIVLTAIIIYFIAIAWTWHSLGFIEKTKKVVIILIGMTIIYGITFMVFQIAKGGIAYPSGEMQSKVQNILVSIFTGINGIIVMPQIGKILDKINEDEIEKEQCIKRIVILAIVFTICVIFESGYMKDTQEGILKIYHAMK